MNSRKEHFIGIDLGASNGKIILGTLEDRKKIKYEVIHRFITEIINIDNSQRWNIQKIWYEIKQGLIKISKINDLDIKGIGIDSWGVNLVYLTKDLKLTCQPFHYRDELTLIGDKKMREIFDMNEVFSITGIQEMLINGLVHLIGIKEKYPEILAQTDKIIMIPDYFYYLLTGKLTTEYTNATTSQLFDARKKKWSETILSKLNLKTSMFPRVSFPGDYIGSLTDHVKNEVQLDYIPVHAIASHDTGSAVIAIPAEGKNWAFLSSGTWSLLGVEISEPIINEKTRKYNFTNEGGAFNTIRLLKNVMGLWILQRCKAVWDEKDKNLTYTMISEEGSQVKSNNTIIDVDSNEFFNPKNMVEAIQDHCKKNDFIVPEKREEIARVVYDSLVSRYKEVFNRLEEVTGNKIERLHVVGGGSRDKFLNQLTANQLEIDVYCGPVEATALGNIMMQARGSGIVKNLGEIREIIRNSVEITKFSPIQ